MQKLSELLGRLLISKKQFKIQFSQYDGAKQEYHPSYFANSGNVALSYNDIISWWWGDSIKMGVVASVHNKTALVTLLGRQPSKTQHVQVDNIQVVCIFRPTWSSTVT